MGSNANNTMISIVIPIYNAQEYLRRCLDSVLQQDHAEYEVLLIDDGSDDSSPDICREYCKRDDRFKYIRQSNGGPDMARRTGTQAATGDYVAYVDADDHVTGNMLSKMYAEITKSNADIVCAQIIKCDKTGREWPGSKHRDESVILKSYREFMQAYFVDELLIGTYYAKLIRTDIMKAYPFVKDGLIGEDISATLYMLKSADKISIIPDNVYYYFQNGDSISHARYTDRHYASLKNYIRIRDEILNDAVIPEERVCGYFAGYEMAVATAMSRRGRYISEPGDMLRSDMKEHWKYVKDDRMTRAYMKLCIGLYIIAPGLFIRLYRLLYLMTGR